jgi:hypothetical protein
MSNGRQIELRRERDGADSQCLYAFLDDQGNLHIDGWYVGPATAPVSDDGEYEYFNTISEADVSELTIQLGGSPGQDILDLLESQYVGDRSYELEKRLRESNIKVEFNSC